MRAVGVLLVTMLACGCRQLFGIDDTAIAADAASPPIDTAAPPDATIDATPPIDAMIATRMFEDGVAGYNGTEDTNIDEAAPNANNSGDSSCDWNVHGTGELEYALLQFTGIFGPAPMQIPMGATILQASLRLELELTTSDAGTIAEIAIPWIEDDSWNSFGALPGVQPADVGVTVAPAPLAGTVNIDVTASLARWTADPATNHGWIFSPPASMDGAAFFSSESGGERPRLSVTFAVP